MAEAANAPEVDTSASKSRPTKPDQSKFEADVEAARKEHDADMEKYNAAQSRFNDARAGKGSPANDRWTSLLAEKKKLLDQKQEKRGAKSAQREKYAATDAQIKAMIAEQKNAKGRVGFKNLGEIDGKIADLNKQVDTGTMRLVDEKKALSEISSLTRQRKGFAGIEDTEKKIAAKKAENQELKKTFDDPEARAVDERFDAINKELDEIKTSRDGDKQSVDALRTEKERLHQQQSVSYKKIREIQSAHRENWKAYKAFEDEYYQQRREKQKAERDAYEKDRRKKVAEQKLEEASQPAFLDQILTTEGLIRYFDPSAAVSDSSKEPGKFAASIQRTVEDADMKGMKVMKRKDEEDFFVGGGRKKKGAKGKKAAPEPTKFNMSIGIIEELGKVGVEPPSNQSGVPTVVEKLKSKLETWKQDQEKQTKENIAKAQKEIDRLEKEAQDSSTTKPGPKSSGAGRRDAGAKKPALENQGVDGTGAGPVSAEAELEQETDAVADAVEDLKVAEKEDGEDEAAVEAQA